MKRLVRLLALVALGAAVAAIVKSLRRTDEPLPTPTSAPSAPWPPLRPEPEPAADTAPPADTAASQAEPEPETADATPTDSAPAAAAPAAGAGWVEPTDDGECPDGHPIKANMKSKIFHSPGQLNYDRTSPDRCYRDAGAAEADGLRAAKR